MLLHEKKRRDVFALLQSDAGICLEYHCRPSRHGCATGLSNMKFILQLTVALLCALIEILPVTTQQAYAATEWDGPTVGPPKQSGKKVLFISQDFRNGGISAAYRGFFLAAIELGWDVSVADGKNDAQTIRAEFAAAVQSRRDAIVIGGFQVDSFADMAELARKSNIVLVGWHAAAEPGPTPDLFVNVATESAEVARMAADYAIQSSNGNIGAVIFSDDRFAVANAKTRRMKEIIEHCQRCKVLEVENIPISEANSEVPPAVPRLDKKYGKAWTHTLAINDVYFDAMNVPLMVAGRQDIRNISAGDGSNIALGRIRSGKSQQIATVAEPAGVQGWQIADELNRAFAGKPPSGYVSKPILVTTASLSRMGNADIDADIPYKAAYQAIWEGKTLAREDVDTHTYPAPHSRR
jgi:ribose transport system substrate-binding protein